MKTKKFKVVYNAPFTLTFCLICTVILLLDQTILSKADIMNNIFSVPGNAKSKIPFDIKIPFNFARLFLHSMGHSGWNHLLGNFSFILLLGPLLEERYGSLSIAVMASVTAFVTGVLNACFIPAPLLGSSGIAFMMILLSSFTTIQKNEIPVSFILVFILYIGKELILGASGIASENSIATFAHIAGGLCGSMFGFLVAPKTKKASSKSGKTATEIRLEEIDAASPRNKKPSLFGKKEKASSDSDETVIGSIEI